MKINTQTSIKKVVCDCSTSDKFIQIQVPCSSNLKSILFLLVMYTIRARCKIVICHCIGCIVVMRCVCFQTGFKSPDDRPTAPTITPCPSFFSSVSKQNSHAPLFSLLGKFQTNCFCNILPLPPSL